MGTYLSRKEDTTLTQLEHTYGTNAFFIQLISGSLQRPKEGLIEWLGTKDAAERYVSLEAKGKKKWPLRPDGFGVYQFADGSRLVMLLEYDTCSESLWRLQDKMLNYGDLLPQTWEHPEKVNVLIITRGISRTEHILQLWQSLKGGALSSQRLPSLWCTTEKQWTEQDNHCLWYGGLLCLLNKILTQGNVEHDKASISRCYDQGFAKIVVSTNFKLKDQGSLFFASLDPCY